MNTEIVVMVAAIIIVVNGGIRLLVALWRFEHRENKSAIINAVAGCALIVFALWVTK